LSSRIKRHLSNRAHQRTIDAMPLSENAKEMDCELRLKSIDVFKNNPVISIAVNSNDDAYVSQK
jgi:hypothetical protein